MAFDYERFKTLDVSVCYLQDIADYSDALAYITEHALYDISIENIRFLMEKVMNWPSMDDFDTRNYTTLLAADNKALLTLVDRNFEKYLTEVLLALETNISEDLSAVVALLVRNDVNEELKRQFLKKQTNVFPSFEGVPDLFHTQLLQDELVEPTWSNVLSYLSRDDCDLPTLTAYLQSDETCEALKNRKVPDGDDATVLRRFLFNNDDLDVVAYRSYVRMLPKFFPDFPAVEKAKIAVLIEERRVRFKPENVAHLRESLDLQVRFVATNFDEYAISPEKFDIDDEFRKKLLGSEITDTQKLRVIKDLNPAFVVNDAETAAIVGPILDGTWDGQGQLDADFLKAVILNSRPEALQVSLLNKFNSVFGAEQIHSILQAMPEPYSEIARFGKSPRLDNTPINNQLATWLKDRNYISSFTLTPLGSSIRINTFKK